MGRSTFEPTGRVDLCESGKPEEGRTIRWRVLKITLLSHLYSTVILYVIDSAFKTSTVLSTITNITQYREFMHVFMYVRNKIRSELEQAGHLILSHGYWIISQMVS